MGTPTSNCLIKSKIQQNSGIFDLDQITSAIVEVEERNKTLDKALIKTRLTLDQQKHELHEILKKGAEATMRLMKIKHEIELYLGLHNQEIMAEAMLYCQELKQITEILADSKTETKKLLIFIQYFENKKISANSKVEEKYLESIKDVNRGPLGKEAAQLQDQIRELKNNLLQNFNYSLVNEIDVLKNEFETLKKQCNILENESVKKNEQKSMLSIELDRLQKSTKMSENRLKATKIRIGKLKENVTKTT